MPAFLQFQLHSIKNCTYLIYKCPTARIEYLMKNGLAINFQYCYIIHCLVTAASAHQPQTRVSDWQRRVQSVRLPSPLFCATSCPPITILPRSYQLLYIIYTLFMLTQEPLVVVHVSLRSCGNEKYSIARVKRVTSSCSLWQVSQFLKY